MKNKKSSPFVTAVIVAGGSASRMQGIDKCFHPLKGIAVIIRSAMAFERSPLVDEIILVTREDRLEDLKALTKQYDLQKLTAIVVGGDTRHQSVYNGVKASHWDCKYLAIHDGGRPLLSQKVLEQAVLMAFHQQAVVVAVPVKDTIKRSTDGEQVEETLNRDTLVQIQTPQVFLKNAWLEGADLLQNPTDDSQLIEALGGRVYLSQGSYRNIKITTPEDILVAEALLEGVEQE